MEIDWHAELRELLCSYFSQEDWNAALEEMLHVSAVHPAYHARFVGALAWGEAAATEGDERVVRALSDCDAYTATGLSDARQYFVDLLAAYLEAFRKGTAEQ